MDITKYESLQNKANVTNYGTLRLVKISRNTFRISGDFQIYRNLGNEVIVFNRLILLIENLGILIFPFQITGTPRDIQEGWLEQ